MSVAVALAAGVGVGVVVGALGAGGGILTVPVMVYLLGQEPHAAASQSLVIVIATAAVSLYSRARRGQVRWREGVIVGVMSTAGALAGSWLNALVAPRVLMLLFSLLLSVVALAMARHTCRRRQAGSGERTAQEQDRAPARSWWVVALAASVTGLLTGFFGVGGGFAVVPMLTMVLGLDIRRAAGTSLVVMIISAGTALAQRLVVAVEMDWAVTLAFMAASTVGGVIGGPLSQKARPQTLGGLFVLLLLLVAASSAVRALLG